MDLLQTVNPATGDVLQSYTIIDKKIINQRIEKAHGVFLNWRNTSFPERSKLLQEVARLLKKGQEEYARLIATEMGKPITACRAEIEKCIWVCEHYACEAESYLQSREIKTDMKKCLVVHQPLGVIFAIMPWNFPFWQVLRFAAPTIMAGNTAVLSHAPISTGTGNAIAALFEAAGAPAGLFQHLIVDNAGAATIIAHERVAGVTLTGSETAGRSVAQTAGRHLKKVVLELGGSDPYIVLEDADLDLAAQAIVTSRLNNSGQVCIAAKRVIAVRDIENELIDKIQLLVSQYKLGAPLDPSTQIGPMARADLRQTVHQQVMDSIALGAELLLGGELPRGAGYYYPATILTNVRPGTPAFDEEVFGPVIACVTAEDEQDAIKLANLSRFGLAAAVFTRDTKRGEAIAKDAIDCGSCMVNTFVASDPRVPFGGIKASGYGRELSREGILEFVNIKTIGIHE